MVGAELLLSLIFASILLSAETSGDFAYGQTCPKGGIIDLTEETQDSSGFVNKSGIPFPRKSMWSAENKILGCICDFKICVPFCCPVGLATNLDGCVADEMTSRGYGDSKRNGENLFSIGNPCETKWKDFASRTSRERYGYSEDVLWYMDMLNESFYPGDYCIFREPNSTIFTALMCYKNPAVRRSYEPMDICRFVSSSIAIVSMMATFRICAMLPELKNLQGWLILNCFASYIASRILTIFGQVLFVSWSIPITGILGIATVFTKVFSDSAYRTWLNVMGIQIWVKFRIVQFSRNIDMEKRERALLTRWSICVGSISAIQTAITAIWLYLPTDSDSDSEVRSTFFSLYGIPDVIIFIFNICSYSIFTSKIKQCKRETAHMVDGVNEHLQENEKWFNLYLKLFIMTSCSMIFWTASQFWTNSIFDMVVLVTEAVQCIFIFLMFIWKGDLFSSIRGVYSGMLRKLASCFRQNSRPVIENGN